MSPPEPGGYTGNPAGGSNNNNDRLYGVKLFLPLAFDRTEISIWKMEFFWGFGSTMSLFIGAKNDDPKKMIVGENGEGPWRK